MTSHFMRRASARRLFTTTAVLLVMSAGSALAADIAGSTTGVAVPGAGDTIQSGVTVSNADALGSSAVTITSGGVGTETELTNSGTIRSAAGSSQTAIGPNGSDNIVITNTETGTIEALGTGGAIRLDNNVTLDNAGTISSAGGTNTIRMDNDADITNTGTMRSDGNPVSGENSSTVRFDSGSLVNGAAPGDAALIVNNANATTLSGGTQDSNVYAVQAGDGGTASVTNYGIIRATGDAATVATGNNEGEVGGVRLGGDDSTLDNYGTIETTGSIVETAGDNQEIGDMYGVRVDGADNIVHNYGTGTITGGKHGVTVDSGASGAQIVNELGGTITGLNGSGVGSDSDGSVTNYGTITGNYIDDYVFGDGDGVDIDLVGSVYNYGTIQGNGSKGIKPGEINPSKSEGIAMGGGTIVNGDLTHMDALISGANNGILIDDSNGGAAYAATDIENYGTIEGLDGYAIRLVGALDDTVTNYGTISGTAATSVMLGDGNDTFNMFGGSVTGTVDAEGGIDALNIDLANDVASVFRLNDTLFANFESTGIAAGYVFLDDDFTSAGGFTSNGHLFGESTVTTATFINNGELYAGILDAAGDAVSVGTFSIAGDFVQGAGGTFIVGLSGEDSSLVDVTGTAAIDGDLVLGSLDGGFRSDLVYTLVSATGGVGGTFSGVTDNIGSSLLTSSVNYGANDVTLSFTRTAANFSDFATPQSSVIANALDTIEGGGTGNADVDAVIAFLASFNDADLSEAMEELAPDTSDASGFTMTQLMQLFQGNVFGHLGGVRSAWQGDDAAVRLASAGTDGDLMASLIAAPSLRPGATAGVWGRSFGAFGDVDSKSGTANGFSYKGGGIQGGIDFALGETTAAGIAVGYGHTEFDPDRIGSDGSADSWLAGLYGTTLMGPVDLSAQIGVSFNDFEAERLVSFGGGTIAHAEYDGIAVGASLEAGYAMQDGATVIRPVAGLDFVHIDTDSYTETGAGGYNLAVASNDDYQLRSTLGVQVSTALDTGALGKLVPSADIRWGYDIRQADKGVTAAFAGAPATSFTLETNTQSRNALVANVAAEAFSGEPLRFGIQASGDFRSDAAGYGLGLYLRYDW